MSKSKDLDMLDFKGGFCLYPSELVKRAWDLHFAQSILTDFHKFEKSVSFLVLI